MNAGTWKVPALNQSCSKLKTNGSFLLLKHRFNGLKEKLGSQIGIDTFDIYS